MSFVNLHVHSHFSLLDGLTRIKDLVRTAKEFEMPAVCLTDHGSLYGAIEFYQACKKEGIKPIIGVETYITSRGRFKKESKADDERFHLLLLAQNIAGYKNLMKLVTASHLEGFYYRPRVDFELLAQYNEGIIATSACLNGQLSQAILHKKDTHEIVQSYANIFQDRFYLELQHHPSLPDQQVVNNGLLEISKKYALPVVATGDSHYLKSEDAQAHDVLLCLQTKKVQSDTNRMCMLGEDFSFSSYKNVVDAFSATVPQALTNTVAIAESCDLEIPMGKVILPHFELENNITPEEKLRELCDIGLGTRYGTAITQEIRSRLAYELDIIITSGFASYFLIVHDFVTWAKKQDIVVGPGRGSAAGSIVAYLLSITSLDPLAFDLLFERFLNPARVSMPDIDLDFADSRRDEVIQYVRDKYGEDHVSHIITFGTMAARVSIRDVGRVLGVPYAYCDALAKMIQPHMDLTQSIKQPGELKTKYETEEQTRQIIDIARKLEGVARHSSTHACGIVITKDPLTEYVPCQYVSPDDKTIVTQYSLHPVEDLGLLKFDFLGLSNLSILEQAKNIIEKTRGIIIDYDALPLNDKKTYRLFQEGKTTGVFQFESGGMKRYLKELKPTEFEDIVAMVALYRPGPMDLISKYINRKHGREPVTYIHQKVEKVLKKTYGIIVYQEQVMDMATELAGMTKGQGYLLIKAVGKKIKSLLDEQKDKFIASCLENKISQKIAHETWELIEPFAGYGFNKAHSACYAMIGYQTAYMKAHYPAEFMASLMTSDQQNTDRITIEIEECKEMGINVLAPDINESFEDFSVVKDEETNNYNKIRFGLSAIKNIGEHIVSVLVSERKAQGSYSSLEDLLTRVQDKDLNKKSLESLIKCGALDRFGERNQLLYNIDRLLAFHKNSTSQSQSRQISLFGGTAAQVIRLEIQHCAPSDTRQNLLWERELLGLYISAHPLKEIDQFVSPFVMSSAEVLQKSDGASVKLYGIVTSLKKIMTKKNEPMVFARIEDLSGVIETIVFPSIYTQQLELWKEDSLIVLEGRVSFKDNECKVLCSKARQITDEMIEDLKKRQILTPENQHYVSSQSA